MSLVGAVALGAASDEHGRNLSVGHRIARTTDFGGAAAAGSPAGAPALTHCCSVAIWASLSHGGPGERHAAGSRAAHSAQEARYPPRCRLHHRPAAAAAHERGVAVQAQAERRRLALVADDAMGVEDRRDLGVRRTGADISGKGPANASAATGTDFTSPARAASRAGRCGSRTRTSSPNSARRLRT